MRILNAFAALSGLSALILLVVAFHGLHGATEHEVQNVSLAAFLQLGAAAAGLAVANRNGVLNLIGGALILAGAALFTAAVDAHAIAHTTAIIMLAPIGGGAMMLGFIVLAFARPTTHPE